MIRKLPFSWRTTLTYLHLVSSIFVDSLYRVTPQSKASTALIGSYVSSRNLKYDIKFTNLRMSEE